MIRVIQATNVRKNFQEVLDEVHYTKQPLLISKHGRPWALIQPLPDEDPELVRVIKKSMKHHEALKDVQKVVKKRLKDQL